MILNDPRQGIEKSRYSQQIWVEATYAHKKVYIDLLKGLELDIVLFPLSSKKRTLASIPTWREDYPSLVLSFGKEKLDGRFIGFKILFID